MLSKKTEIPTFEIELLKAAYAAFNVRDIDAALATMTADVAWPMAFKGGFVRGHEAVRAYWTEQWSEIDPHVEPISFHREADGRVMVEVHQIVRALSELRAGTWAETRAETRAGTRAETRAGTPAGAVLADVHVGHRFTLSNGLIQAMEVCSLPSSMHGG